MWRDAPLFLTENQGFRDVCALKALEIQGKSVAPRATFFECVLAKIRANKGEPAADRTQGRAKKHQPKDSAKRTLKN